MRTEDTYLIANEEATYGVEAATLDGSCAIRVKSLSPSIYSGQDNEAKYQGDGGIDRPIRKSNYINKYDCDVELTGSGFAGTGPNYGVLLKSCGMKEQQHSVVSGTATGGSTTTVVLAVGASAVDDFYKGMQISITSGTGAGQKSQITAYVGATKTATVSPAFSTAPATGSGYTIFDYVEYSRETNPSLFKSHSAIIVDGVAQQTKLHGVRGQFSVSMKDGVPTLVFSSMIGKYNRTTTIPSAITVAVANQQRGVILSKDNTAFSIAGQTACLADFSIDSFGSKATYKDMPNCKETRLQPAPFDGKITIRAPDISTYDWLQHVESHSSISEIPVSITNGTVGGNIVTIDLARVQITNIDRTDIDGDLAYSFAIRALGGATIKIK